MTAPVHDHRAAFATNDGARIAYRLHEGDPLIVLVAGTASPGSKWPEPFVRSLVERGLGVLTFDHRGTGETPGNRGDYSMELFADDAVACLRDAGKDTAFFLGHSMGGRVAQQVVLRHRERVDGVVLAATGPGRFEAQFDDGGSRMVEGIPIKLAMELESLGFARTYEKYAEDVMLGEGLRTEDPDRYQRLLKDLLDKRPSLEEYLKHVVARQRHDVTHRLSEVDVPALVIVGSRDTSVRGTGSHFRQSEFLAETLPDASFEVIEGAAHGLFWYAPEAAADAVATWISNTMHRRQAGESDV